MYAKFATSGGIGYFAADGTCLVLLTAVIIYIIDIESRDKR